MPVQKLLGERSKGPEGSIASGSGRGHAGFGVTIEKRMYSKLRPHKRGDSRHGVENTLRGEGPGTPAEEAVKVANMVNTRD